jgi:hypothetical protein
MRRTGAASAAALFCSSLGGCSAGGEAAAYRKPDGSPPGFRDAARESGITFSMRFLPNEQGETYKVNIYDHGCGLAVGDYDGDGFEDGYFLNQMGANALYRNRGDGTFEETTAAAGVGLGDRICVGAAMDDYDNDGDQDLYVTSTRGGNVLFRNNGDGTFTDVTAEAGLTHVGHSQTPVFFDADRDGYLDLFVTNTAGWTTSEYVSNQNYYVGRSGLVAMAKSPREHNLYYRNNGDGTFTDATKTAGLEGRGWGGDVVAFDYDEDGWMDLFVTNMLGRSQLYRNLGRGRFADVTRTTLGKTSWGAIGSKALDYDGDGRLDLLVTDMHSDMWMTHDHSPEAIDEDKKYRFVSGAAVDPERGSATEGVVARELDIVYEDVIFGNTLFKNLGGGRFREVSDEAGMETFWPWGIASGDFDSDGYVDAFIPSGMGYPYFYWRNYLMMNQGDGTFVDRSREEGIDPPSGGIHLPGRIRGKPAACSSRCAVAADFDGDGHLDLMTNNFNDRPYYLRNQFPAKSYIGFALTGTRSNRDAVGALVRLQAGGRTMVRQVEAAGGYLSRGSKRVHFGLDDLTAVDRVEIRWPSGARQTIERPAINTLHRITEASK